MSSLLQELLTDTSSSDEENDIEYVLNRIRKKKVYRQRCDRFALWEEADFIARFRVSKDLAKLLALRFEAVLKRPSDKNFAVTPAQQILIALEYFACGSFQRCVGDTSGVHKTTVSRIIHRVSRAIATLRAEFIFMPRNPEEMAQSATRFHSISAFPKVVGAIDCTHIPIKSPGGVDPENYRNRKDTFTLNVQAVCNADMYITNIVARWPGASHDSHIFNSSVIKGRFEDGEFKNYWLLGDKGYAVKPYLLTPLRRPVTGAERLYNESHIRTRNVVERMFGCWKALAMKLRTNTTRAQAIIVATAVLHNICKRMREQEPPVIHPVIETSSSSSSEDDEPVQRRNNDATKRTLLINSYFDRLNR